MVNAERDTVRGRDVGRWIRLWKDRSGAAAAEIGLALAILGAAMTFGALALGGAIEESVEQPAE